MTENHVLHLPSGDLEKAMAYHFLSSSGALEKLYAEPPSLSAVPVPVTYLVPGRTAESTRTLAHLLKKNLENHHIFLNHMGFHNHLTHHLYVLYALGATSDILQAAYSSQAKAQRPIVESPGTITKDNWKEHLGDDKFYQAYMVFFSNEVQRHGIGSTLEEYVFAADANWSTGDNAVQHPQMLTRFFSSLLHGLIHVGHGCEFGSLGMCAEGIAMTCVTKLDGTVFLTREAFEINKTPDNKPISSPILTIITRMLADDTLAAGVACRIPPINARFFEKDAGFPASSVIDNKNDLITHYTNLWGVDTSDPKEAQGALCELAWLVAILYGVGGVQGENEFVADFFLMHLVTSSGFLPFILKFLRPSSQSLLLRTFFSVTLIFWVSRGRPAIDFTNFYRRTSVTANSLGSNAIPALDPFYASTTAVSSNEGTSANPWLPILHSAMFHPNEHLPKILRTLAHYAIAFSAVGPHLAGLKVSELPGATLLDDTLFVRVATLTLGKVGPPKADGGQGDFDFDGLWPRAGK